jgi:hypothetical protein
MYAITATPSSVEMTKKMNLKPAALVFPTLMRRKERARIPLLLLAVQANAVPLDALPSED